MSEAGQWIEMGKSIVIAKVTLILLAIFLVAGVLTFFGKNRTDALIEQIDSVRVEKIPGKQSWTLVYQMQDGTELECVTIEGFVVAAEKR